MDIEALFLHCRGTFTADASLKTKDGILPDSFLAMPGWSKGVLFLNGFNLGWYWPQVGPQMTMYIPGPMLLDGENELILLEVEDSPKEASGRLVQSMLIMFGCLARQLSMYVQNIITHVIIIRLKPPSGLHHHPCLWEDSLLAKRSLSPFCRLDTPFPLPSLHKAHIYQFDLPPMLNDIGDLLAALFHEQFRALTNMITAGKLQPLFQNAVACH